MIKLPAVQGTHDVKNADFKLCDTANFARNTVNIVKKNFPKHTKQRFLIINFY